MVKASVPKKLSKSLNTTTYNVLLRNLEDISIQIQNIIMNKYDEGLVGVVTDRNSKTNPSLYRDEFAARLAEFNYIDKGPTRLSLSVPTMENFDFSGRLKVLENIMHGLAGVYVEVNEEDFKLIFNKAPINEDPLDDYVLPKDKIYLVKYSGKIKKAENELNKTFVRYPFSNMPPIKILEVAEKFVDDNIERWLEEALEEAKKIFVLNYKGATL